MEGIQSYLRYIGFENPYELTKEFSRGEHKSLNDIYLFIDNLNISVDDKNKLKELNPYNYLGKYPDNMI
jgi:adenylosuccinate lyase